MNINVKRGLYCALAIGGLSLLGTTAAHAADSRKIRAAPSTTMRPRRSAGMRSPRPPPMLASP